MDIPPFAYSSIHWTLSCSHFLAVVNNAAVNTREHVLVWAYAFISLGCTHGVGLLGHMVTLFSIVAVLGMLTFYISCIEQSMVHLHQQCMRVWFVHLLANTCYWVYFLLQYPGGYEVVFSCRIIFHFHDGYGYTCVYVNFIFWTFLTSCLVLMRPMSLQSGTWVWNNKHSFDLTYLLSMLVLIYSDLAIL